MIFDLGARRNQPCAECEKRAREVTFVEPKEPTGAPASSVPPVAAFLVIGVVGAVGWLLQLGFDPEVALGIVGGAGLVAIELIRRLTGRGPGR